jgi:hypothetical protein
MELLHFLFVTKFLDKQTWSCSNMDKFLPTYRIKFIKYIEIFANIYVM